MHNNDVCYICVVLDILNYLEMIQNMCGGLVVETTLFHKWDLGIWSPRASPLWVLRDGSIVQS